MRLAPELKIAVVVKEVTAVAEEAEEAAVAAAEEDRVVAEEDKVVAEEDKVVAEAVTEEDQGAAVASDHRHLKYITVYVKNLFNISMAFGCQEKTTPIDRNIQKSKISVFDCLVSNPTLRVGLLT